jgi:hypothetical protein
MQRQSSNKSNGTASGGAAGALAQGKIYMLTLQGIAPLKCKSGTNTMTQRLKL